MEEEKLILALQFEFDFFHNLLDLQKQSEIDTKVLTDQSQAKVDN